MAKSNKNNNQKSLEKLMTPTKYLELFREQKSEKHYSSKNLLISSSETKPYI